MHGKFGTLSFAVWVNSLVQIFLIALWVCGKVLRGLQAGLQEARYSPCKGTKATGSKGPS